MTNPDDYAEEWDQLDEKVILAQILAELQQIRLALTDGARDTERDDPDVYACTLCPGEQRVPAGERERHAQREHKALPSMVGEIFEEVE